MVTDDESHLIRLSGPSEISIFSLTPPTSLNPLPPKSESDPSSDLRATSEALGLHTPASKVRSESTIRGLFLGPSKRFGTGAADVDPVAGGLGGGLQGTACEREPLYVEVLEGCRERGVAGNSGEEEFLQG
jgi:hypothetical protein